MELTLAQLLYILTVILVWFTYIFNFLKNIHMFFIRQYHIRRFRDQWAYSDGSHND